MKYTSIVWWAIGTGIFLMVPFIVMQFTNEVAWGVFDFVLAGGLIFGAGVLYEFLTYRSERRDYRTVLGVLIGGAVLAIWVHAAVGIF